MQRRDYLNFTMRGLGATAALHLLMRDGLLAAPNHPEKAKRAVQITLVGGLSHVDSFDPKPALAKHHGEKLKTDTKPDVFFNQVGLLRRNDWDFKPRGESGLQVSELFPHIAGVADELAVIRSTRRSAAGFRLGSAR